MCPSKKTSLFAARSGYSENMGITAFLFIVLLSYFFPPSYDGNFHLSDFTSAQ
jgi:hypothetical protein